MIAFNDIRALANLNSQIKVAGPLGFEPRQAEPKSAVLPLHYGPIVCESNGGTTLPQRRRGADGANRSRYAPIPGGPRRFKPRIRHGSSTLSAHREASRRTPHLEERIMVEPGVRMSRQLSSRSRSAGPDTAPPCGAL